MVQNEFRFKLGEDLLSKFWHYSDYVFHATKELNQYKVSWEEDGEMESTFYPISEVKENISSGDWVVVENNLLERD